MEKMRKLSGPNTMRQAAVTKSPSRAGSFEADFSHCSTKMTRNRAVMVKSMPVESKGRNFPATAPISPPAIQYRWSSRAIKKKNHVSLILYNGFLYLE